MFSSNWRKRRLPVSSDSKVARFVFSVLTHSVMCYIGYVLCYLTLSHHIYQLRGPSNNNSSLHHLDYKECDLRWSAKQDPDVQLIFGIGTGRCGTMSLRKVLSSQLNSTVSHEMSPHMPWYASKCERLTRVAMWTEILLRRPKKFTGDIASWYLPYVHEILHLYPRAKIFCLTRSREEVIESFAKRAGNKNHWQDPDSNPMYEYDAKWNLLFPHYNDMSREESIGKYWDTYYKTVHELFQKYGPQSIYVIDMDSFFNDAEEQKRALKWLGYTSPVALTNVVENQSDV